MGQRPPHVKPPAHLSKSPPVPAPDPMPESARNAAPQDDPLGLSPTRYGDWSLKGIAIDF